MKLLQEVYKLTSNRRRIYFLWKNGLSNNKTDYGEWSKEDIINKFFNGSEEAFKRMELWEKTDEYARLMYILTKERMNSDFFEIYDVNSHINPAIILKLKLPHIEPLTLNFAN